MNFRQQFAKEFWPRLFWACAIGHIILLVLYFGTGTVVAFE